MYDYPQSNVKYSKIDGIRLCACMGEVYGEPFCPCVMARQELPMSISHVIASEETKKRIGSNFWGGWIVF